MREPSQIWKHNFSASNSSFLSSDFGRALQMFGFNHLHCHPFNINNRICTTHVSIFNTIHHANRAAFQLTMHTSINYITLLRYEHLSIHIAHGADWGLYTDPKTYIFLRVLQPILIDFNGAEPI